MALPMLLGAAAKGIVRGGGRAAASRIMGRKKTVKPSAIAPKQMQQGQQQQRGGALVKSPTAGITKAMAPVKQVSTGAVAKDDYLGSIHKNVVTIEQIVLGVYQAELNNVLQKKKDDKDDARKNQEQKLESKPQKEDMKKPNLNMVPKLGVFGWIKRFIGNILMGLFLQRMVDFAGFLPGIVKAIDGITTFLADFGMILVNGLVTFADWGIKAYNFTFGAIEKGIGPLFGKHTDKVLGLIDTALFLTTTIASAMAIEALSGGGDGGPGILDFFKAKKGAAAVKGATAAKGTAAATGTAATGGTATAASTGTSAGAGAIAGAVIGAGLAFSALGEGIFQLRKFGLKYQRINQERFEKASWFNPMKYILGASLAVQKLVDLPLMFFQHVFDLLGAPFRYAIELIRFGVMALFGDTEGMKKQRKNLAKFDARIRENIRQMLNMVTLGFGFREKGSFGNIYGDDEAQSEMMNRMSEGGKVAPRKKVKRGIDIKKKKKRKLRVAKPSKERLAPLPPMEGLQTQEVKNERAWWDFLGWAGTGGSPEQDKLGPGGKKLAEKVTDVGNKLGENDYFGPILRLTSKVVLDQDVTARDYLNVGRGINLLLDDGMRKGAIGVTGYNEGGTVDNIPQMDVTGWVRKTFEDGLKDDLKKKYVKFSSTKYGTTGPEGVGEYDSATGEFTGSGTSPGTASGAIAASDLYKKIGANAEQWDIFRNSVALIESGGDYSVPGGSGMHYDGRYQMGAAAKTDGSRYAGVPDPGHSDDPNAQVRAAYRANKELQEIIFTGFTLANHTYLMGNETYKNSSIERKLQILGYAHNQGMGGAEKWITTGVVGADGFGTKGTKYTDLIAANFRAKKAGGDLQIADNAISVPSLPDKPGSAEDTSGGGDIKVSGSGIVNIGKDLISKGFSVAEHPDFTKTPTASGGTYTPGKGSVSNVHKGRGHYEGRAIDVTDWRGSMEDSKARYRSVLTSLQDNPAIKMLIHDSWGGMYAPGQKQRPGAHGHPEHMHIEVKDKGGFIGKGLFANLGGTEFVTDADSTAALRQVAPGLMMALNQASDKSGIANVLRDYASYEQGSQQTVVMQDEGDEEQPQENYGGESPTPQLPPMIMGESSNPFEFLEYQG